MTHTFCTHSNVVNSGLTGPNVTKFLYNVDKSLPFKLLKSELQFSNQIAKFKASSDSINCR